MADKTRILFAAFEAVPFIKTGGLGDVVGSLPAYIKNDEFDARVVLPLLDTIPQEYQDKMRYVKNFDVPLGWRSQYCGLFTLRKGGVTWYFLDNEYYFKRGSVYGHYDDGERVAFFSGAVVELIKHISRNFKPDILHCNDWHTALAPVFMRELHAGEGLYDGIKTVFTIHNLKFQGQFDKYMIGDVLGLHETPAEEQLIRNDTANYMQGAVIYSDAVTTVSPTYAAEICTPEFGENLEELFMSMEYKLSGILNGIDRREYDPMTDEAIAVNYSAETLDRKIKDKLALQRELGLTEDPEIPLYAMVSRLTHQKGADLVAALLPEFEYRNMQLAILGTGDKVFEDELGSFAVWHSDRFAARITFDESMSRRFYAGADVFIMPSEFEPCGLAQMIAMRYGTLPLVRETGGLKDTVSGVWDAGDKANGFSFKDFDLNGLRSAVDQSLDIWFNRREMWKQLQLNAMNMNYGWEESAEKYRKLYSDLLTTK